MNPKKKEFGPPKEARTLVPPPLDPPMRTYPILAALLPAKENGGKVMFSVLSPSVSQSVSM